MEFEKIRAIICNLLEIEEAKVTPETQLEDLGVDSLDMIDMVMDIEDEFGIEVTDEALEKFDTVRDIVNFVENC